MHPKKSSEGNRRHRGKKRVRQNARITYFVYFFVKCLEKMQTQAPAAHVHQGLSTNTV